MVTVVRNDIDYRRALEELEALMDAAPAEGTREADRLALLALVIQDFETHHFPMQLPDPIAAIEFRMDQAGLTPRDLIPFIGSRSKVSEVLARKRPLSLAMIRSLVSGLEIPAEVLVQPHTRPSTIEAQKFPVREMIRRGWLDASRIAQSVEAELGRFLQPLLMTGRSEVFYRQTQTPRSKSLTDPYSLTAWTARVLNVAATTSVSSERPNLTLDLMSRLTGFSRNDRGPLNARDYLASVGIALVIEPALPRIHLDGAAMLTKDGVRVIGLTLRHDRLDNFWYTLMHELAHLALHISPEVREIFDDLDGPIDIVPIEQEADEMAGEALVPQDKWKASPASRLRSQEAARHLANSLGISPAIVAGRIRREFRSYRVLGNLVGHGQVRRLFLPSGTHNG